MAQLDSAREEESIGTSLVLHRGGLAPKQQGFVRGGSVAPSSGYQGGPGDFGAWGPTLCFRAPKRKQRIVQPCPGVTFVGKLQADLWPGPLGGLVTVWGAGTALDAGVGAAVVQDAVCMWRRPWSRLGTGWAGGLALQLPLLVSLYEPGPREHVI